MKLGEGAFGLVHEALLRDEESNTWMKVAVKTTRTLSNLSEMKALVSEMKILIHARTHPNVLAFIGACTKDLRTNKLLVIVEHCAHGSLQEYISKYRKAFVNQMNSSNGVVRVNAHDQTEALLSTTRLMDWALQVARGMVYLAEKKVIHRDLATRNVLLTRENVVKIADFGLSKKLYTERNYRLNSNKKLPFKLMAVECFEKAEFSTRSDVWAYGVFLWELFSLGSVPYPGMDYKGLHRFIKSGNRLTAPKYANAHMYCCMCTCWNESPYDRPSFDELVDTWSELIGKIETVGEPSTISSRGDVLNKKPYWRMSFEDRSDGYLWPIMPQSELEETGPDGYLLPSPPTQCDVVHKEETGSDGYLKPNVQTPTVDKMENSYTDTYLEMSSSLHPSPAERKVEPGCLDSKL